MKLGQAGNRYHLMIEKSYPISLLARPCASQTSCHVSSPTFLPSFCMPFKNQADVYFHRTTSRQAGGGRGRGGGRGEGALVKRKGYWESIHKGGKCPVLRPHR